MASFILLAWVLHSVLCDHQSNYTQSTWIEMDPKVFAFVVVCYFAVFFIQWKRTIFFLLQKQNWEKYILVTFHRCFDSKAALFTMHACTCVLKYLSMAEGAVEIPNLTCTRLVGFVLIFRFIVQFFHSITFSRTTTHLTKRRERHIEQRAAKRQQNSMGICAE